MSSALAIRGFLVFNGATQQGFFNVNQGPVPLKPGDPVLQVIDLKNVNDVTSIFNGTPLVQAPSITQQPSLYLYQNSTSDLSLHGFLAVFGVGPVG